LLAQFFFQYRRANPAVKIRMTFFPALVADEFDNASSRAVLSGHRLAAAPAINIS
jgi:hypothetical protein